MKEIVSKKFRYTDERERYKSVNKFYFIGMNALYVMFIAYLFVSVNNGVLNNVFAYANIGIVIVFEVVNIVMYLKNKASKAYGLVSVILGGIELFILAGNTEAQFATYAVIIILMLQIPYLLPKRQGILCIVYGLGMIVVTALRAIKGHDVFEVDALCSLICVFLGLYVDWRLTDILKRINDDALGSLAEQSDKVKVMFDGIVESSEVVFT